MEKAELGIMLLPIISGLVTIVVIVAAVILLTLPISNFIYKAIKGSSGYNASGCLVLSIMIWPFLPAYIIAFKRYSKEIKTKVEPVKQNIQRNPTDSNVNDYMDIIEEYGIYNDPKTWNQVRAVWFVVNESSAVTTQKKKELRNFLMSKGLRLTNSDKNVIDNYRG